MAKITESRIFEVSKYLATKSGKELEGVLTYLSSFAELVLRNLRNGLTFGDNLDCEIKRVTVRNAVETVVAVASKRRPVRVYLDRVLDSTFYVCDRFGWRFNNNGDLVIKCIFDGSPSPSLDIQVDITLIFG